MARTSQTRVAGGVAVLATIAVAAVALIFSGSSAAQAPETLVVVASLEKARAVPVAGRSAVGDYFILRFSLREEGGSTRVGTEIDDCLIISRFLRQMCDSAFTIRGRGHLITKGLWDPNPAVTNVFAITGGTGDFTGAGGTATFEDLGDGRVRITFEIT